MMNLALPFIYLLALVFIGSELRTSSAVEVKTEYVSGIFKLNSATQAPIFYNTYVPLVLEYKIPKFDTLSLTLNPRYSGYEFCEKQEYTRLCPTTFFINQLVSGSFSGNLTSWNYLPGTVRHGSDNFNNFCDELTTHFPDFKASGPHVEKYLSRLKDCYLGGQAASVSRGLKDYDFNLKPFYANFSRSVEQTFYGQTDAQHDDVVALNAHSAIYGIFLTHVLMESQRWAGAMSSCQAGRIPHTLVTSQKLTSILSRIQTRILVRGYKLSLPMDEPSKYYKLPLTDCVLVDQTSLLVRILIPVVEEQAVFEHLSMGALPFLSRTEDQICFVSKISDKEFVEDLSSGQRLESSCNGGQLCRLPRYASDWPFAVDHCLTSYLNGSHEAMAQHCHLECMLYTGHNPIFRTVNASTLVVAGNLRPGSLSVHCEGKELEVLQLPSASDGNSTFGSSGSLRIHLPCNCKLNFNRRVIFRSGSAHCGWNNETEVTHILPFAWKPHASNRNSSAEDVDTIVDYDGNGYNAVPGLDDYYAEYDAAASASTVVTPENPSSSFAPEVSTHTGILYVVSFLVILILATLSFIIFRLIKIEKWRMRQEADNDHGPIMSYHVFQDQED
jgi:hypothetical protein